MTETINGHLTQADGRRLALDLLRIIEIGCRSGAGNHSINPSLRKVGAPQNLLPVRHTLEAYATSAPAVQEGFEQVLCSVLDDFVAGCTVSVDDLEREAQ